MHLRTAVGHKARRERRADDRVVRRRRDRRRVVLYGPLDLDRRDPELHGRRAEGPNRALQLGRMGRSHPYLDLRGIHSDVPRRLGRQDMIVRVHVRGVLGQRAVGEVVAVGDRLRLLVVDG